MPQSFLVVRTNRDGRRDFLQPSGSFGHRDSAERFASAVAAWKAADKIHIPEALNVVPTGRRE